MTSPRNPRSKFLSHQCPTCGKTFVCSEHCNTLWKKVKCNCIECDTSPSEWKRKCKLDYKDWLVNWVEKATGKTITDKEDF